MLWRFAALSACCWLSGGSWREIFDADLREYELPGAILHHFGITQVRLMTNNPGKIAAIEEWGILVAERVPCQAQRSDDSDRYLQTKKVRLGHLLEL